MKKKNILEVIILILIIGSIFAINIAMKKNDNTVADSSQLAKEENDYSLKTIIVQTDNLQDIYGAISTEKMLSNFYILKYENEEQTKVAFENFQKDKTIISVELDQILQQQDFSKVIIPDLICDEYSFEFMDENNNSIKSWGMLCMGFKEVNQLPNINSNNIVVAVIDTGFDLTNPALGTEINRIDTRYYDVVRNTNNITDADKDAGHGTFVASQILDSTAQNVKVLPINAYSTNIENMGRNGFLLTDLCDSVQYATQQDVDVINMSLGIESANTNISALKTIILEAKKNGITVVVAAGNSQRDANTFFPANINEVITVSALTTTKLQYTDAKDMGTLVASSLNDAQNSVISDLKFDTLYSNYGEKIDYCAPGSAIIGLGNYAANSNHKVTVLHGTSQATPYISSAVATIKSYKKNLTDAEVEKALDYYAIDLGDEGKDVYYGKGFVCFKDAVECTCGENNCYKIHCIGCNNENCIYCNNNITLEKIEINTPANKTLYEAGDNLSIDGLSLKCTYSDNSTKIVNTGFTCSPNKLENEGTQTITVTYEEKTTTFNVTVEKKVTKILKDESNYNINNNYIQNINQKTDINVFLSNISTDLVATVKKQDIEMTTGNVGTGMIVTIKKDNETIGTYILVVTGDTNGNGTTVLQDVVNVIKHYNNKKLLTNEYLMAIDTNVDGVVTLLELISEIKLYNKNN